MNMFEPSPIDDVRRTLEVQKWRLTRQLSRHVIDEMDIDVVVDRFYDSVAVSLTMQLHGEKAAKAEAEESMAFPTTWWQHLKRDFAPAWFLARWPVKTNTWKLRVTADQWRMYHNMEHPLPPEQWGRPLVVIDTSSHSFWERS